MWFLRQIKKIYIPNTACSRALVQVLMEVLFAVVQLCLLIAKLQAYECFPSAVRATGVTILVAAGRLGQSVGEMLVDIARLADFWSTLLIIATGLLACQMAIRWLPEKKDVELPEVQREVGKPFRLSDVLLLPEFRAHTAALSVAWFWCFLARFSLSQVRPSTVSVWDQPPLALLMLPMYATGYPLVIKWNRLTSLYMAFAVASTAAAGAGLVMFYGYLIAAQVLMEVLFAVVQQCLLIAKLQAYECFPSAVRATGVTMLVAAGRLGQSVGEILVDIARLADFWSTLLIIATGLLVCQLAIRWLPETKDVELPEVQREVLAQGQLSSPKEPSMARHIESCTPSVSHHDSTADNRKAAKHTHSEGAN
ncbi:hypothetical protein V5799_024831 [Amblyomma americanum]|uniref:Transporter n=1 Tax=Amblyomma americanum TaxID=6943 RepID=A0AAQ4EAW8_AMBAM